MSTILNHKDRVINAKKLAKKYNSKLGKVLVDTDKFYIISVLPSSPNVVEGQPLCIVSEPDGTVRYDIQFNIPEVKEIWDKAAEERRRKWKEEHSKK